MDSSKIKAIIVTVLATFAALYLGIAAATAQFEAVLWVVGGVGVSICLLLGRRIWLLIPFASGIALTLPIPGNFSTEMMAQIITLGFGTLLFLMRRLPIRPRFTELEFWCLIYICCVIQAYLRNPVGLNIFGSDSVGAKPYVLFCITMVTAYMLSIILVTPNDLRWWVRLSVIGSIGNFTLGLLGKFVPSIGYYLGASFSTDAEDGNAVARGEATRIGFVRGISVTTALWISSRISPLMASFHPKWVPLVLFALGCAAISGYRSQLIMVCLYFLVGIFYRGGLKSVIASCFIGAFLISLLAFVNLLAPLPPNVQRALTFLPGTWDERYITDAEGSTDWRVEMWKEALFTEKWIQNKWLGDGLGFSKAEFETMQNYDNENKGAVGVSGMSQVQESMMIGGGYHSGPVQTIRTVGYVGLAILLIGMIRVMVYAHRQILRTRNTEWFPVALFICIPFIVGPIFWWVIIGSFDGGSRILLMGTAMIAMLDKNLPLPSYSPTRTQSYSLPSYRNRSAAQQPGRELRR